MGVLSNKYWSQRSCHLTHGMSHVHVHFRLQYEWMYHTFRMSKFSELWYLFNIHIPCTRFAGAWSVFFHLPGDFTLFASPSPYVTCTCPFLFVFIGLSCLLIDPLVHLPSFVYKEPTLCMQRADSLSAKSRLFAAFALFCMQRADSLSYCRYLANTLLVEFICITSFNIPV